jgi:hypothetical protein
MTSRPPPPTRHNPAPAPSTLPEELLLARFVLVRRDGAQPLLSPIYDGPYRVLERSTHFFLGDRTDKVSTLRLKAARTPADTEPAKPPHRGRPCPRASTGDLQPTTYYATNNFIFFISIRPPAMQHSAAKPTQPVSLPPQSLGGTCGGVPSVPTMFPATTVT